MLSLVDAHCHLDLYENPRQVASAADLAGVYTLAVTNAPSVFTRGLDLVTHATRIRLAVGLHPQLARRRERELPLFAQLAAKTRYIGEVGLDYSTADLEDRHAQVRVFESVLRTCATADKVLSVHSRKAGEEVLDAIGHAYPATVIHHWFTGSPSLVARIAKEGHFVSVNPAMARSGTGRRLIAALPPDRILTETDGPFVEVSGRPAQPADVLQVVKHLADAWGTDEAVVARQVLDNFRRVLDTPNLRAPSASLA